MRIFDFHFMANSQFCRSIKFLTEIRKYFSSSSKNKFIYLNLSSYVTFLILVLLGMNCASNEWYRKLPEERSSVKKIFSGKWVKSTNPRSAMNSSWHKNSWSEEIEISQNRFKKKFFSTDIVGKTLKTLEINASGEIESNGNWLLLKTKSIDTILNEDGKSVDMKTETYHKSMLYYYNSELNLLFPMIHDRANEEKVFGIKDGVNEPYNEKERNFNLYMKIFAFKDFQPHAYRLKTE